MKLESFGRLPRYALVLAGGAIEGQRPRTALFEVFGTRPDGDYQGKRCGCKSRRAIKRDDVLAIWRGKPHQTQIDAVRRKLPIVAEIPSRATDAARLAVSNSIVNGLRDIFSGGAA